MADDDGGTAAPSSGRRILGMKPTTAYLVFGGALAVGIIAYLIKEHQASTAAAAGTDTAATTTGTDSNQIDYSGELSTIQTELEALLAQTNAGGSAATGNGGGSWGGGGSSTGSGGGTNGGGSTTGVNNGGTNDGGGSTTTTTKSDAPTGGKVDSVNNNRAVVSWNANGATKWTTKITGPGPINGQTSTVESPDASYSGLSAGHNYEVLVTPVSPPGPSGTIHFTTTK